MANTTTTRLERRRWLRRYVWEITRTGKTLSIYTGRRGEAGVQTYETLDDLRAAYERRAELIRQQLTAGWTLVEGEVYEPPSASFAELVALCSVPAEAWRGCDYFGWVPGPPGPAPDYELPAAELARNDQLEARLLATDADEDWRVYADWLQAQGDELGAYINQCMNGVAEPALAERLRPLWLGEQLCARFAEFGHSCYRFEWRRGFIHRAWVSVAWDHESDIRELLAALLGSPAARFLRELQIGLAEWDDTNTYVKLGPFFRARAPLLTIERLFIGSFSYPEQTEISWTEVGDVHELPACFPCLRDYGIRGGLVELGELRHTQIERLALESGGLNLDAVQSVMQAQLPKLRELELWFGEEGYGAEATITDLAPLLAGRFDSLEILRLRNGEFGDQIIEALLDSPALPRLRILDLSMGTLHAPGAALLLEHAEHFAHLELLELDDNYLSEDDGQAVQAALPAASLGTQRQPTTMLGDQGVYYVSVGE